MKSKVFAVALVGAVLFAWAAVGSAAEVIKVGFNIPLTGDIPKVGEGSKYAGEMLKERINKAGGLKGGQQVLQAGIRLPGQ